MPLPRDVYDEKLMIVMGFPSLSGRFSKTRRKSEENVFRVDFRIFRDTVKECQFKIGNTGNQAE